MAQGGTCGWPARHAAGAGQRDPTEPNVAATPIQTLAAALGTNPPPQGKSGGRGRGRRRGMPTALPVFLPNYLLRTRPLASPGCDLAARLERLNNAWDFTVPAEPAEACVGRCEARSAPAAPSPPQPAAASRAKWTSALTAAGNPDWSHGLTPSQRTLKRRGTRQRQLRPGVEEPHRVSPPGVSPVNGPQDSDRPGIPHSQGGAMGTYDGGAATVCMRAHCLQVGAWSSGHPLNHRSRERRCYR